MEKLIEAGGFGLVTSAVICLAAVGLTLQVGVTNFVNFAYGDFMTFGAFVAYWANSLGLNFFVAAGLGAAAAAILGVTCNLVVFRPFVRRKASPITLVILSIGLALIVQNMLIVVFGTSPNRFNVSVGTAQHFGPLVLTPGDVALIALAGALLLGLHVLLQYTKFGRSLRATSGNADLAASCGIDTGRVATWTWAMSGALAAVAGIGLVLETSVMNVGSGFGELFLVFAAMVLGGIGRPYGAMVGGLVVGMAIELSGTYLDPAYSTLSAFVILVVVLLVRPQGIFASRGVTTS